MNQSLRSKTVVPIVLFVLGGAFLLVVLRRTASDLLDLTTAALFLGGVTLVAVSTLEAGLGLFRVSRLWSRRLRLLCATLAIVLLGAEMFLRLGLVILPSHGERNFGTYRSFFQEDGRYRGTWLHIREKNSIVRARQREFEFFRQTNSLGLSEREIGPHKEDGEYRVVALGDSMTEGVGASYASSWVRAFERRLAERYPARTIVAVNAGIAGSDVVFAYMLLKQRLLAVEPDLVIVAINDTDIGDIYLRGGMERFHSSGSVHYPTRAPSWEPLYALSYVVRLIVHGLLGYDEYFVPPDQRHETYRRVTEHMRTAIDAVRSLAEEHGYRLLLVFQPTPWDIENGRYAKPSFSRLIESLQTDSELEVFDLFEHYREHGSVDRENVLDFYWRFDGHHNAKGYALMGHAIAEKIERLQWIEE